VPREAIEASVLRGEHWEGELQHLRANGEQIVVLSRWTLETDSSGRPIGYLEINRDITDRKQAELERERLLVLERAARHEADTAHQRSACLATISERVAESLDPEAMVTGLARLVVPDVADWCVVELLDPDGTIRLADAAHHDPAKEPLIHELRHRHPFDFDRRYGLTEVLRTGKPQLCPVIREEWRREAARDLEHLRVMESLNCRSSICVPLVARGRILGALTFAASDSGRTYGAADLALAEEVARRCALALDHGRLHERLKKTLHLREAFLASIAHDLRNPLNVISGFTQVLQRMGPNELDAGALGKAVDTIATSATTLAQLVDELQDIVMVEAGQPMPLRRAPTDLVALAREAAAAHTHATSREFRVAAATARLVGEWDRSRLRRVLDNLLSNAAKYSPDGGEVVLTIGEEGGSAVLRVRDEGMGIPADDLPRLFERFHRGRNVGNRIRGTGLGLWGVRRIVEEHDGTIAVESQEGVGTTVTVLLPLHEATETAAHP
jgi:signal transduction histidine kinase